MDERTRQMQVQLSSSCCISCLACNLHDPSHQTCADVLAMVWLLFTVCGSLVPLDFHGLSLQPAWVLFSHLPWLALGAEQRAESVASGLLYLPAGALLTLAFLRRGAAPAARTAAMLAATAVGCTLAVTVGFVQVFFPQRTT